MTLVNDAWDALRREGRSERGWHVRRVHETAHCEILAGIRQPGSVPGLLLEIPIESVPAGLSLPKSKGFVVDPVLLDGGACARVRFALILTDATYETVFSVLCDDTAYAASAAKTPQGAIRAWIGRLHVWQAFMARHGAEGLSETAAIGLFGELLAIRELVVPAAGIASAIQAWAGPLGEPNDFAFPGGFIEVKTTNRQAPELIEISDAAQLDDSRGVIFLIHVRLLPSPAGETLPKLVTTLRAALCEGAAEHLERFDQLLMSAGYLDAHAGFYDRTYALHSFDFFKVSGNLPRLRPADIPTGIRSVTYTVELSACSAYATDIQAVRSCLGWN